MNERKLIDEIKKLVEEQNIINGFFNGTNFISNNGIIYNNLILTSYDPGKAFIVKYQDSWICVVSSSNEVIRTNIIVDRRNRYIEPETTIANIKILFSKIEDDDRNFYVLDENSKKKILSINSTINSNFIQGNIFNYGGKNKYTNSIQYIESSKLNAFNIVSGTIYPLWDIEQIYSSNNIPYLGSSILSSQYFNVPYFEGTNTSSTTYSGGITTPGTIRTITSNTVLNIATPSTYFSLSGSDSLNLLAEYQNDNGSGEPGYSTYYQLTTFNLDTNTKSFYSNKTLANNNEFTISQENSTLYNATLATVGFSSASTVINQYTNINGFTYLGQYIPEAVNNEFTQTDETVINTIQNLISGSIVTTSNTSTITNEINANLLLIQGTSSEIISSIDYSKVTVTDLLTNISTPTITNNINYYLYTSSNPEIEPITLNKIPSIIIQNFSSKITDISTTSVTANTSLNLTGYIGESVSYAQYIDSNSSWLANGVISNATSNTVTITLSNVTKSNFVSYATTNGTAISDNGSLFSLLGIFRTSTTIINRYILLNGYDISYLTSFTELLKYGCLIKNKFYICQNKEAVKTSNTNLYVEQWDISSNGNITRNNKLIKLPVNSLNSENAIIHSIQYWNTK